MKPATVLVLLCLSSVALSAFADKVDIDTTHKPDGCDDARKSKAGDKIHVHYTGSLQENGKVFDSSRNRGQPFTFTLGAGQVIKGWDQGLIGACVGEKRTLTIPPSLGYGDAGAGGVIPGGATLVFETEVVKLD